MKIANEVNDLFEEGGVPFMLPSWVERNMFILKREKIKYHNIKVINSLGVFVDLRLSKEDAKKVQKQTKVTTRRSKVFSDNDGGSWGIIIEFLRNDKLDQKEVDAIEKELKKAPIVKGGFLHTFSAHNAIEKLRGTK